MKEEEYERFIKCVKSNASSLNDKNAFHQRVMEAIDENERHKKRFSHFLSIVASLIVFISVGLYVWYEMDTRISRMALSSKQSHLPSMEQPEWQCRHSVKGLMASVVNSGLMPMTDNGVLVLKSNIQLLKEADYELYSVIDDLLSGLQQTNPALMERYNAGESISLSAWQLRKEYHVCEWLLN